MWQNSLQAVELFHLIASFHQLELREGMKELPSIVKGYETY